MKYLSTRGSAPRTFSEILVEGLAPDGGLYVPETYAGLDIDALRGLEYPEIAARVLAFYAPEMPFEEIRDVMRRTYTADVFGSPAITPLVRLDDHLGLLKLSEGPTLAFKDVALQLLGNLMERAVANSGTRLNILGATSGDTGSAAEYAVRGRAGLAIFMLSPEGRMSPFQQRQMYTLDEPNIFNIVIRGTFDDCQAVVKEVNADSDFKKKYHIGAVNSINWARIVAQTVYYIVAYLRASEKGARHVSFAVPSGNFGNALAAYVAKRMGVPVRTIAVCTNANDVLDEFFRTGIYRVRKGSEVKVTSSPSMDIASASNFERLIFEAVGRDSGRVRALWSDLARTGEFSAPELSGELSATFSSRSASNEDVIATIRSVHETYGIVVDPHTAVGIHVGLQHSGEEGIIVAETAQPVKFADTIREALGVEPEIPATYHGLADLPEKKVVMDPDPRQVKDFIARHA